MAFKECLKIGKVAEELFERLLLRSCIPFERNENNDFKFDISILIDKVSYYIEIKHDIKQSKTKNIAIEYFNTKLNKNSGILSTQSDLWVIVLDNPKEVWITSTKKLKEYFLNEKPLKDIIGGDNNSKMKIYKSSEILSRIFHRVDNINPFVFYSKIKELLHVMEKKD